MSFWNWAAQSDSIRQLPKAKRALNAIRSETHNKYEESNTEKTARLYKAVLTPEELVANPIIRAEIISNIPMNARASLLAAITDTKRVSGVSLERRSARFTQPEASTSI